jgi:hypothetical protein
MRSANDGFRAAAAAEVDAEAGAAGVLGPAPGGDGKPYRFNENLPITFSRTRSCLSHTHRQAAGQTPSVRTNAHRLRTYTLESIWSRRSSAATASPIKTEVKYASNSLRTFWAPPIASNATMHHSTIKTFRNRSGERKDEERRGLDLASPPSAASQSWELDRGGRSGAECGRRSRECGAQETPASHSLICTTERQSERAK